MGHYPERFDFSEERKELIKKLQNKLSKLNYEDLKNIYVFMTRIDFYLQVLKPWFGKY